MKKPFYVIHAIACFLLATALFAWPGCYEIPSGGGSNPPAPDVKKSDVLWILTIDDQLQRANPDNAASTALLRNGDFWKKLKDRGHKYRQIDSANPSAAKYQKQVNEAGGIPCVIIADDATKKEFVSTKLTDEASLTSLISKYTDK